MGDVDNFSNEKKNNNKVPKAFDYYSFEQYRHAFLYLHRIGTFNLLVEEKKVCHSGPLKFFTIVADSLRAPATFSLRSTSQMFLFER